MGNFPYWPIRYFPREAAGGGGDFPDPSNVTEDDTTDGVAGTFHIPSVTEVALGVLYGGGGNEFTGTYAVYTAPLIAGSDIEASIYTVLSSDTRVKARVNTRIYPLVMPQDPILPAITYQRVSGNKVNTLKGYSGLENPHIAINTWARTYDEAKEIADYVHSAMDAVGAFKAILINDLDGYDPDINLYVVSQDYSCWDEV